MRRWVAILFLLLVAFYASAARPDPCEQDGVDRGQICHILCNDGCATAPVPVAPVPPAAVPRPRPSYGETPASAVLSLELEPERTPPRG